jgi:hypothetical protein
MWSLFPYGGRLPLDREQSAWRVAEFLGLDRCRSHGPSEAADWHRVVDDPPVVDLAVLDDADLGFRHHSDRWPMVLRAEPRPWILLTMAHPIAQGAPWDSLHQECAERLTVVIPVNDRRLSEVPVVDRSVASSPVSARRKTSSGSWSTTRASMPSRSARTW